MTTSGKITREQALEIAGTYEAEHRPFDCVGIGSVVLGEELQATGLTIYGFSPLEDYWVAYAERSFGGTIRSSDVIVVSKSTGKVVYAGSANDEG